MANDRQIQVSCRLLEEVVQCLELTTVATLNSSDADKALITRANRAISSLSSMMKGSTGPGDFSGSEIGLNHVDPTQSPFL